MARWPQALLLLFLAFQYNWRALVTLAVDTSQSDAEQLLAFRASFNNSATILWNWTGDTPCRWIGIKCDASGAVINM